MKENPMNVKLPLGLVLIIASALGYLLGTDAGREQRDSLMRKIQRQDDIIETEAAVIDGLDVAAEAVATEA
ncbi:MAG: hypothetical protein ACJAR2_000436 [Ilumatobacter sp.]|jgi:hypothetical protein